jgi:hypothetical protein
MKGIIIIGAVWILINLLSYLAFGPITLSITSYTYMLLIWIFRKKLTKLLNI